MIDKSFTINFKLSMNTFVIAALLAVTKAQEPMMTTTAAPAEEIVRATPETVNTWEGGPTYKITASERFSGELEWEVTVPMGQWILFRQHGMGEGKEDNVDAVLFQGKGDCDMEDMWFEKPAEGGEEEGDMRPVGSNDGNNNYHDTDRRKDQGVCTFKTYRKFSDNDNQDLTIPCDAEDDRIYDWHWEGSSTGGEWNQDNGNNAKDDDKHKKFAVLISGSCDYVFASAMKLAFATASMAAVSSLYM